jgi:Protein of unknown function (DUF3455)
MKICKGPEIQITRRILLAACVAALTVAFTVALPRPAHAYRVNPPPVPGGIQAPAGSIAFFEGHAVGTQNYICLPSGTGFMWTLFGPQATLFNDDYEQVITHFLSPNPQEGGTPRATWQHSRDTSSVWALSSIPSSDANFVAPGAIPWLLLSVVTKDGPTGGDKLSAATHIHRVNTSGGIAPATGCAVAMDVGKKVLVPYTADYFFYKFPQNDLDEQD